MSEESFTIWERHLVGRLGIGLNTIREARGSLAKDQDWVLVGRRVMFSAAGVENLKKTLGLDLAKTPQEASEPAGGDLLPSSEKNAPAGGVPCADCPAGVHVHNEVLTVDMQIWEACRNPIWVRAHRAGQPPRQSADLCLVLLRRKLPDRRRGILLRGCRRNDKHQWEY